MALKYCLLLLLIILFAENVCTTDPPQDDDAPGFEDWFQSNNQTLEDYPIYFENPLPLWIRGTLIRNGPGQLEMGKRKFNHCLDGFAKLRSWKFPGNASAFFSTKLIQTRTYTQSVDKNDIAPYLTFKGVTPPFDELQKLESFLQNMDNTVVNVYNYSDHIVATNDIWENYEIDPNTLNTIGVIDPPGPPSKYLNQGRVIGLSSSHPLPEYGKSSKFNILNTFSLFSRIKQRMSVIRVTSLQGREIVAEWETEKTSYMHSFSVTPNYVILLAAPCHISILDMLKHGSVEGGMQWDGNENATFYVVDLKTGSVQTLNTEAVFVVHHINAFELHDGRIVIDVPAQTDPYAFNYLDMSYINNKTARMKLLTKSVLTRYTLDLKSKKVDRFPFVSGPKAPCAGSLEMPVINENYRHMNYCIIYGQVLNWNGKGLSHIAIAKKNVCDNSKDLMYASPHQYFSEPWFVSIPGGQEEDDGILMVSAFDGDKRKSYLALINPKTMTLLNKAYLPTRVPFSFHGRFFNIV